MSNIRERMAEKRRDVEQDVIHVIEIIAFLVIVVVALVAVFFLPLP